MTDSLPSDRKPDACLRCGSALHSMGVEEFRVGGTTGGWKLLFGEWAELGEDMLKLEVRACKNCGQVEFRVPGSTAEPDED
jgi:ribosomal protein S27AE